MNTRSYRTARTIANLEASFDGDRQRLAQAALDAAMAERTAQGIAAIEPAQLAALFAECPWRAWGLLAGLSERQMVIEAIDYACWLLEQGVDLPWGCILRTWTRRLAERAAEAEALLALAEQGAFDADGAFEDEGREPEAEALRAEEAARAAYEAIASEVDNYEGADYWAARPRKIEAERVWLQARAAREALERAAPAVIAVELQTRPGIVYQVAEDGSACTCPGHRYHGHCKHADAQAKAYTAAHEAVYGPSRPDGTPGYGGWGHAA